MKPDQKKHTTIRIRETTMEAFDRCAAKRGVSRNLLLQHLMDRFVREDENRPVEGLV